MRQKDWQRAEMGIILSVEKIPPLVPKTIIWSNFLQNRTNVSVWASMHHETRCTTYTRPFHILEHGFSIDCLDSHAPMHGAAREKLLR